MKRLFSRNDCNGYTYMKQVLINLDLVHQDYLWLISDIEAFPNSNDLNKEIEKVDYLLLTTQEFVEMLDKEDFQWIWAVFSAIPSKYTKEEILKYPFPIIESVSKDYNPFLDEPKIQHPLADFEICSCDASEMFIVSDDESLLSKFKASYPLSIDDTEHKVIFDDWRLREPNVFQKRKKEYFFIQSFMVVFLIAFFALSFIYYYFFIFTLILVFTCLSIYFEWLKVKNNHLVITKKSIFITNRFKKKKEYKVDLSNCYLALKPSVKRGGGIWLQFYDNQDNFICDYEDVFNHASLYGEEPTRWEEAIKELNIPIIDVNEVIKN